MEHFFEGRAYISKLLTYLRPPLNQTHPEVSGPQKIFLKKYGFVNFHELKKSFIGKLVYCFGLVWFLGR